MLSSQHKVFHLSQQSLARLLLFYSELRFILGNNCVVKGKVIELLELVIMCNMSELHAGALKKFLLNVSSNTSKITVGYKLVSSLFQKSLLSLSAAFFTSPFFSHISIMNDFRYWETSEVSFLHLNFLLIFHTGFFFKLKN